MGGKLIAIGLASLTVFVVLVIGVEALVVSSVPVVKGEGVRGYWAEAITAVSTVVVMGATTVYAAITYDMVRAIKQQTVAMSTSTTRAHVTELSRFLTTWINPLLALKASVAPNSESTVNRIAEQDQASKRVTAACFELVSFSSASPPSVMALIKPVNDAAFESMRTVDQVRKSISGAARSAMGMNVDLQEDLFRRLYRPAEGPPADSSKTHVGWTRLGMPCEMSIYCTSETVRPASLSGTTSFLGSGWTRSTSCGPNASRPVRATSIPREPSEACALVGQRSEASMPCASGCDQSHHQTRTN